MVQGTQTEDLVLQDRAGTALLIARTIGNDTTVVQAYGQHQQDILQKQIEQYLNNSNADSIRIYNQNGEIILNSSDERDKGRVIRGDKYLNFALTERKQLKSFDTRPGVSSPEVIARALYPMMDDKQTVTGVVEVDYIFDNAFVDYSKAKTGLDVTIYADKKRAATTILTLDKISRWTGSEETVQPVIDTVLGQGKLYSASLDRLGQPYYSAFGPIRDVNGVIIGMVGVGTPTAALFEETRQQLITTFLLVMLISMLVALIGYIVIKSFGRK
jgi:sensor histidine kinase regulating citrate/malate metabolism